MEATGLDVEVHTFQSGYEAINFVRISLAEGHLPSLMIIDMKMPEISGDEMLELMVNGGMKKFPTIILSGSSFPEDEFRARKWGADACYEKPITLEEGNRLFREIAKRYLIVDNSSTGVKGFYQADSSRQFPPA